MSLPRWNALPRPLVMGVLNVTPDSFSDGAKFSSPAAAVDRAFQMVGEGADLLDIGGESTRPGAEPVSADEELRRVLPVIERLAGRVGVPLSIDTYKAEVAAAAVRAGASIVNDVSGGRLDPEMAWTVAESKAHWILGHMRGTPKDMQQDPVYRDVVAEVGDELMALAAVAEEKGVPSDTILVDPGIGFGKTLSHNLSLLKHLDELVGRGRPVCVGTSRKGFLGKLLGGAPPEDRVEGTAATAALAVAAGASIVRAHDVKAIARVVAVAAAVTNAR